MNAYFLRQLSDYVNYHRDPWNCAMHVFGIVFLFLAAVLPFSAWPVSVFGAQTTVAALVVLPVLIYWLLLDAALGMAIAGAAVVLLSAAALIVQHASPAGVWFDHGCVDRHRHRLANCRAPLFRGSATRACGQSDSPTARTNVCDGEIIHYAWLSARSCRHSTAPSATSGTQPIALPRGSSGRSAPTFMTRVLVTGGSGFIGQHLVSALVARGRQTRVLDLHPPAHALPDVQYVEGSVLNPDIVKEAMSDVGEVYHLAGLPGMWLPDKNNFHAVNCRGTEVVIAAARKHGITRFLHCSTNPFFSALRPREMPLREIPCLRPTPCRVHTRARKCSRNSSPCKLRHLVFRW